MLIILNYIIKLAEHLWQSMEGNGFYNLKISAPISFCLLVLLEAKYLKPSPRWELTYATLLSLYKTEYIN